MGCFCPVGTSGVGQSLPTLRIARENPRFPAGNGFRHNRCSTGPVAVTNTLPLTQASASLTNAVVSSPDLGGAAGTLIRLTGALALVFAALIGVVWVYRQWQRVVLQKAPATGLRILDVKNLGQRTSLYVVAYRHQQFLLGGSANGLSLLSPLEADPAGIDEAEPGTPAAATPPGDAFRSALDRALSLSK